MLKREITYETFSDEPEMVTDVFYFNISEPEMVELEAGRPGGFIGWLTEIQRSQDEKRALEEFKNIILLSCGVKSEDGRRFMKSQEIRDNFYYSGAYISLFQEFMEKDGALVEFMMGIFPKRIIEQMQKLQEEEAKKPAAVSPPVPPTIKKEA